MGYFNQSRYWSKLVENNLQICSYQWKYVTLRSINTLLQRVYLDM